MNNTNPHCKAIQLKQLRSFTSWYENKANARPLTPEQGGDNISPRVLDDRSIVYLHSDLSVSDGVVQGDNLIFTCDDHEWKSFCANELNFSLLE